MANDTEKDKESDISQEHTIRVKKTEKMRAAGIEPWPSFKPIDATCKDVLDEFYDDKESRKYAVAGRVMALREHGKTIFAHIQDRAGRLQIYIRQDDLGKKEFEQFRDYVDIGDIIWCTGTSFRTRMGEVTLKVTEVVLLSKSLHPLPEKFHGIADVEIKYRQRYLDLISNPESRDRFQKRAAIIKKMRSFLETHDFVEVETPMLQPIPGGAVARPFVTHHNALNMDLYLRIASELYLKRMVVAGFERVYEIGRTFRNEGISTKHNPEFTMMECYAAYLDYHFAMDFVEKMLKYIVNYVCGSTHLPYNDYTLDFESPFKRMTMQEAVAHYAQCSMDDLKEDRIDTLIKKYKIELENEKNSWGYKLNALFEELVEAHLIQPTFITEFPIAVSPLAKRNPENPLIADRYELFIAGMELSNGFNELNDPFDQAQRFKEQAQARSSGDVEAHYYDEDYIIALEYALPPTVGIGVGIDRLTMLVTNTTSIKDVILFPTLKKKE
ncbi:MAG: lysine--tRNA ligase [Candidatus Babeliales bacterium]